MTIATPSSEHLMPWADTAEPTPIEICRDDRSRMASFWITGSTKTLAPITTFCPDRSVEIDAGLRVRHRTALATGDDERLVRPGDLQPADHQQHDEDDEAEQQQDSDQE